MQQLFEYPKLRISGLLSHILRATKPLGIITHVYQPFETTNRKLNKFIRLTE